MYPSGFSRSKASAISPYVSPAPARIGLAPRLSTAREIRSPSPLGPAFSPPEPGAGYHGYRFRIIAGRDDQDAALLAWPVEWGETGVMSFMIDLHDTVYQANLGEESAAKAQAITRFAPDADAGWQVVKP